MATTRGGLAMAGLLSLCMNVCGCQSVQKTDHGFKTDRVIATRVKNEVMGQFVKLEFPHNGYDSDKVEVGQFIEMNGGNVFQGGGSPYAPAHVTFKGISDPSLLDKKLREILPGLNELLARLDDKSYCAAFAKKYEAWDKAHNPQWPDTTPIDKSDPYWEINNNLNANGTPYHKVEVSSGKWQWQVDEKAQQWQRDYENKKWELYGSLSSRKLSRAELINVYPGMNVSPMTSYFQVDIDAQMYDALVKQWELQTGEKMKGYRPLSTAKGEYNRSPQEQDNRRALESLLRELQQLTETTTSK